MQYCPDCGAEVESGDRFCLVCGTALDQSGRSAEPKRERTPADTPSGTGNRPPEPEGVESGPDRLGEHGRTPPQHRSPRSTPHPNASGSRFSKGTLTAISILSAVVAILFLPPVLGGISIYSGYKIYDVYDESLGRILIVVGVLATIAGMALGVLLLTA